MLFSKEIISAVASFLKKKAKKIPIVLDPVMVAKSGDHLLLPEAVEALKTQLIPIATVITPNIPEALCLTGLKEETPRKKIAEELLKLGAQAVFLKGGHDGGDASNDLLMTSDGKMVSYKAKRIDSKNTHGTGCTLSAAIASCLSKGLPLKKSCQISKNYLLQAIDATKEMSVGKGQGPVHHFHHMWPLLQFLPLESDSQFNAYTFIKI
jgi:hydroxymethylpyrimidine/phosphomethylpyrimidine kinase